MIVSVEPGSGTTTLEQPEDCRKFHVEASGHDLGAVARALGTPADAPEGHVWVPVAWVRAEAAGRVPDSWAGEFDGMLGFARTKGWLSDDGGAIQAHVEWRD